MRRPVFYFLAAAPLFLAGARKPQGPDEGYLEKSLKAMGGYPRYERVETASYDFAEGPPGAKGAALARGRHFFKFHDGLGLRGREERVSPEGRFLTIFDSSNVWRWEDGKAVEDPARLRAAADELRRRIFWLFLPHTVRESSAPARYSGLGYLRGRLMRRLDVDAAGSGLPSAASSFTLYLDSGSYLVRGVTFAEPGQDRPFAFVFDALQPAASLELPVRWLHYDPDENLLSERQLYNLSLNSYVDEALFRPPEGGRDAPNSPEASP